jgi:hypothetical protein
MGKIIVTIPCSGKTDRIAQFKNFTLTDENFLVKLFKNQHKKEFESCFKTFSCESDDVTTYSYAAENTSLFGFFDFCTQVATYYSDRIFFMTGPFNSSEDNLIDTMKNFKDCQFKVWLPEDEELFFNFKCRKILLKENAVNYYTFADIQWIKERILETSALYNWPVFNNLTNLLKN